MIRILFMVMIVALTGCVTSSQDADNVGTDPKASKVAKESKKTKADKKSEKFKPVVGGACLSKDSIKIWKNTKPGNESNTETNIFKTIIGGLVESQNFGPDILIVGRTILNGGEEKNPKSKPVCGNWCGANYPKPNENPKATDRLDKACRAHDLCYRKKGKYNCACDEELAYAIFRGRNLLDLSRLEAKIVVYFRSSSCEGKDACKKISNTKSCAGDGLIGSLENLASKLSKKPVEK